MKRNTILQYQQAARKILTAAGIPLPDSAEIEIADFGKNRFEELGLALVVRVNEAEYCSKWLVLLPGQQCPAHYHILKKETFFVHTGQCFLRADDRQLLLKPGDSYTLEPRVVHEFWSDVETIVEEVSTHDENLDSYFIDPTLIRETNTEE